MSRKQSQSVSIGGVSLKPGVWLAIAVVVAIVWAVQHYAGAPASPIPTPSPTWTTASVTPTIDASQPTPAQAPTASEAPAYLDGLPTMRLEELPLQALDVLELIGRGGPFPYRQDGGVFQNREGLLPAQLSGYYHEYTVETPGSSDRGARRIVRGDGGEVYYTDDHYASFRRVIE